VAGKTTWQCDKTLSLLKGSTVTGATQTWLNLFTVLPTHDDNASSGGGTLGTVWIIDRVQVFQTTDDTPRWSDIKSEGNLRYVDNVGTISWSYVDSTGATPILDDVIVKGIGIWDGPTSVAAHNLLYWEAFDQTRTVANSDEVIFSTGDLKVRED
jgi:hypothetical protein